MERPNPSHGNAQIYQEACEWFVEFRLGEPDDAARRAFHAWLRESPAHMGAYLDVSANWTQGAAFDVGALWSKDQLIEDARRETERVVTLSGAGAALSAGGAKSRTSSTRRRWLGLAAASAAVSMIGGAFWIDHNPCYSTGIGEQRSLALSDGSTVQLNSLSKIRIRYSEHERTVDLVQGQALFHVAKDTARPFVVYSGQTRVRAVGTRFDVYRRDTGTTVTVLEGRVAVLGIPETADSSKPGNPAPGAEGHAYPPRLSPDEKRKPNAPREGGQGARVTPAPSAAIANPAPGTDAFAPREGESAIFLGAGEQLTVTPAAVRRTPQPNLAGATAWTQRRLVFDATPLSEVAEEFNRYNERQLNIRDPSLLDFQIDGIFSSTDPASLIRFLRERPEMQVTETETEIIVTRRPVEKNE